MAPIAFVRLNIGYSRCFSLAAFLICALLTLAAQAQTTTETLVASNSTWRFFRGISEASEPPTEWRTNTFDDSAWETGEAPFYFFATNAAFAGGTLLTDMRSNYTCIFLRQTFVLTNVEQYITLTNRPWADDGYITWLNGIEVNRQAMGAPGAFVPYNGNAAASVYFTLPRTITSFTNALRLGTNVMAVQIFNVNSNDADFFANPDLSAGIADTLPPSLLSVSPAPGSVVTNLFQVTLAFSETVVNVKAADLQLNGASATTLVSNSPSSYSFRYPLAPEGVSEVRWNPAAAIRDLSGNPYSETNDVWYFTNVIAAPYVVSAEPPFGSTVTSLTTITVHFSAPVSGVLASEFFVGGYAASSVSGSGTIYTFTMPALPAGALPVTWDVNQTIMDGGGVRMNEASNTWHYMLVDVTAPVVASRTPASGATVGGLTQVEVRFSEPVNGVDAGDLTVNGTPCASVFGSGMGPYIFQFNQPGTGLVQFAWSPGHNIRDQAPVPNAFAGGDWAVTLHPALFAGDVVINEFAAANVTQQGTLDYSEFARAEDWIELHNRGSQPVRLLGWSLTDNPDEPGLWTFPDVTLNAGQYLVVYASGANRTVLGGTNRLHTNFKLNPNGSYLALFNAQSPRAIVSQFSPAFPEQRNDYSYGLNSSGEWRYYQVPTPGAANGNSLITEIVSKPKVSVAHGMFEQPFILVASCETPGATIRYTTDGTVPSETVGQTYTGPLQISNTTILRLAGFRTNTLPSRVATHSYIFMQSILTQSNNPPGFPTVWQGCAGCTADAAAYPADYEMDPEIVTNSANAALIQPALKSLPVVSIVMPPEDLFSTARGIYVNSEPSTANRYLWERACSAEMFFTNQESGFQIDCGIRLQGNASRTPSKSSKHPFRLLFKGDYGEGSLDYPVFPNSPVREFDGLVFRADFNNSWVHWEAAQRLRGTRIRDAWGKETFRAMGQFAGHTRHVHLFLNGLYWGIYDINERIDADFASSYLGGDSSEWDAIVSKPTEAIDGNMTAYNAMIANVRAKDMRQLANYTAALGYLDVTNFVDYMLLNFYAANADWGYDGNWNAMRRRAPGALFQYFVWDAERYIENIGDNRVSNVDVASGLHTNLINSAEYKLFFADGVQKHLFNDGALTSNQMTARWLVLANRISTAQVAESARWGDNRRDVMTTLGGGTAPFLLYDRTTNWLPEINRVANTYFAGRHPNIITQLRNVGLFPSVTAPAFNQYGGRAPSGFGLTMVATNTIYYTTNGLDPRVYGSGAIAISAQAYGGPVVLGQSTVVKARALFGTNWSPLVEAIFTIDSLLPSLRITEIAYNPFGGDAFEFIELQNTGPLALNIGNYSVGGIEFVFPFGYIIGPGQRIVLANNLSPEAFALRHPGVAVAGYFGGSLANGGETISLVDTAGRTVVSVTYDDENGWPTSADGGGYSLELVNVDGDPDEPANWRASGAQAGSPGTANSVPAPPAVLINEIMAENLGAVVNDGTLPDWIELHNPTGNTIDLTGWSVTDDGNPRKFVFSGVSIAAGGYLVVWADAITNTTPGIHLGFALGRNGDRVLLYDANTNLVDAISFGPQVPNKSIGRVAGEWMLTMPTTNAVNAAAPVATAASLSINEWLANSAPGFDDWLELFNSASNAVLLQNVYLGTSNALFQIRSLSFVPPGGFVQLIADERAGADHLDFRLNAAQGTIILYNATGAEVQRVNYGAQLQGVSQGRLPNGSAAIVSFPNSASPAASNYLLSYSGPVCNELLARNASAVVSPFGTYADYVELYNPSANAFDLGGMGLSDDAEEIKFVFAPGTTIPGNGFLVVWCDGDRSARTQAPLNSGFALNGESGGVNLFNAAGQIVNSVAYGSQVSDMSIGMALGQWRLLASVTPGSNNGSPATLGLLADVRINEWMADAGPGEDDWFELHNSSALPVSLSGAFLTDDLSLAGMSNTPIAALSFIGAGDWVRWIADGNPANGRNHAGFSLDREGDSLRLYAASFTGIDTVSFGAQSEGVSEGRLPDSGATFASFVATPTPGGANYLPLADIVISEVLTHTDPPLEDAIELRNTGTNIVDLSGWWLSDASRDLKKFRIPPAATLAPGQFVVFYENQFNAGGTGTGTNFTLNSARGESVFLSETDGSGNMTGYRATAEFGAAANGVSFGRFETSTGVDFTALSERTFGADAPATLNEFRTGTGLPNAYAKVGPVVISEIMYRPVSGSNGLELAAEEFVELQNITTNAVPMFDLANPANGWRLAGGVTFHFNSSQVIAPTGRVTLVSFDPMNAPMLAAFHAKYGSNGAALGPFSGRLNNAGEALELYKPDAPQPAGGPDAGFVPMVLVDRVAYGAVAPWPTAADGGGASLQRITASAYGNEVLNWAAQAPTAGAPNDGSSSIAPIITQQPQNQSVVLGQTAIFTVSAQGSEPLSYQWLRGGGNIPNATGAALVITNVQPGDAGTYRVRVSNLANFIFSQNATLTVFVPAYVIDSPQDITAVAGTTVQLNVTAGGTGPLRYQWRKNETDLPGEDEPQLNLANVQPGTAGQYSVVVSNNYGWATSAVAVVAVIVPPSITSEPEDATVLEGGSVTFEVSATGTAPLVFQWRRDGTNILGANSSSFSIGSAQTADAGVYSVVVSNTAGYTVSLPATLQVVGGAHLLSPQMRGDGVFEFTLFGQGSQNYTVQYSTDLSGWTNLTNITLSSPVAPIIDPSATNAPMRFYRVRREP